MRRFLANALVWVGWLVIWYFGILAFILLMGIAKSPRWVGVLSALGLLTGIGMELGGNYLRERGVLWRARRDREMRAEEARRGPFGDPRGEG